MKAYKNAEAMTLETAFPDFDDGGGIFDYMTDLAFVSNDNKLSLNLEYYTNRSGQKLASPLVARYVDDETGALTAAAIESLAHIIMFRFKHKWSKIWQEFSSNSPFVNNLNVSRSITHGKKLTLDRSDETSYTGSESDTVHMTETTTDTYGGEAPRKTSRQISGSYSDNTLGADIRSGYQKVTDKGATQNSIYGFNSSNAVPQSVSGPADNMTGITQETQFGDGTEGSGVKDSTDTTTTRTYTNYKDEVTESGEKTVSKSYGADGKQTQKTFTNRKDTLSKTGTETYSGTDTETETGYRYLRSSDKLELIRALYSDPQINDFFEVVYNDIDTVLTCPIFV